MSFFVVQIFTNLIVLLKVDYSSLWYISSEAWDDFRETTTYCNNKGFFEAQREMVKVVEYE